MQCIGCGSTAVSERNERTTQCYRRFRCRAWGKQFNERSERLLNRTQHPSDVIALVVLWRLRYKLSLRDLPEMFLIRGIVFSHETATGKRSSRLHWLKVCAVADAARLGKVGTLARRTSRCTGIGAISIAPCSASTAAVRVTLGYEADVAFSEILRVIAGDGILPFGRYYPVVCAS
jgi:hypothetical protein